MFPGKFPGEVTFLCAPYCQDNLPAGVCGILRGLPAKKVPFPQRRALTVACRLRPLCDTAMRN